MKKFLFFVMFSVVITGLLAQAITDVRLEPAKSSYYIGENVKIFWNYTGLSIPSSATVKITLWREGSSQSTCKIAEGIPITQGSSGYQWTIPSTCTNPHNGAQEDLTQGNLWIRVRWQNHRPAVYGESPKFTVKAIKYFGNFGTKPEDFSDAAKIFAKFPTIYDVKFARVDKNLPVPLYKITWKYKNFDSGVHRVRISLLKGIRTFCDITFADLRDKEVQVRIDRLCRNGKKLFTPRVRRIYIKEYRIKVEEISSPPPHVYGVSERFRLPYLPELIVCVSNGGQDYIPAIGVKIYIQIINIGDATSKPCKAYLKVQDNGSTLFDVPALNPGTGIIFYKKVNFFTIGTKKIIGIADYPPLQVAEWDETNNYVEGKWEAKAAIPLEFDPAIPFMKCSDGTQHPMHK